MLRLKFCMLLLLFLVQACTSETDTPYTQPVTKAPTGLHLNSGKKWQADEATTENISQMQQTLNRYQPGAENKPEAFQQLGRELRADLNKTFRDCTMTGQAHEVLHQFLIPIEQNIEVLEANDPEAALAAQLRIEEQLSNYADYFE